MVGLCARADGCPFAMPMPLGAAAAPGGGEVGDEWRQRDAKQHKNCLIKREKSKKTTVNLQFYQLELLTG